MDPWEPEQTRDYGTLGLYLGWVCVAVCANITAALRAAGFDGFGINPDVWATAVLFLVAAVGVRLAKVGQGRLAFAAAVAWGLAWIAVAASPARLNQQRRRLPPSPLLRWW